MSLQLGIDLSEPEVGDIIEIKYKRKSYIAKIVEILDNELTVYIKDSVPTIITWIKSNWHFPGPWNEANIDSIKIISKVKHGPNYLLDNVDHIKKRVMVELSGKDLENFCKLRENRHLCENDKFMESVYHEKIKQEFPPLSNLKNELLKLIDDDLVVDEIDFPTWKGIYKNAKEVRHFYFNDKEMIEKNTNNRRSHKQLFLSVEDPISFMILDKYLPKMEEYVYIPIRIETDSVFIIKYLANKNPPILPNQRLINGLIEENIYDYNPVKILEYLATLSLFPDKEIVNRIKADPDLNRDFPDNYVDLLNYFEKYDL